MQLRFIGLARVGALFFMLDVRGYAGVTLDTIFPTFLSSGITSVVIPGNWDGLDGPEGWIPARLFGTTTHQKLTLRLTVQAIDSSPTTVTLRTRDGDEKLLTRSDNQTANAVTLPV